MPPKRSSLSTRTQRARRMREERLQETPDTKRRRLESHRAATTTARLQETTPERERRQEANRAAMAAARLQESTAEREKRQEANRAAMAAARLQESTAERERRQEANRAAMAAARLQESTPEKERRQKANRVAVAAARHQESSPERRRRLEADRNAKAEACKREQQTFKRLALLYDASKINIASGIGSMINRCRCQAFKFKDEPKGFCCSGGSVVLPAFPQPPPLVLDLLDGTSVRCMRFRENIRTYNNAFQMTSFGHKDGGMPGYNPTVRIQGQVYHRIGSLLPPPGSNPSFLQVYFVDSREEQVPLRRQLESLDTELLLSLTNMLHEHNTYVQNLKTAKETLDDSHPNMKVVIREDKRPQQEHARRYNQQQSPEIAILMENEPTQPRDIVLRLRDGGLQRISELHRSYDPLQYPLIFVYGTDGYNIYLTIEKERKIT